MQHSSTYCVACEYMKPTKSFGTSRADGGRVCRLCYMLKRRYKLTYEEYKRILDSQEGCCKICTKDLSVDIRPSLDHDHACCPTDKSCGECIRGILCNSCNVALGCAKDSPDLLDRFISYLTSSRTVIPSSQHNPTGVSTLSGESKICTKCLIEQEISCFAVRTKSLTRYSWCNRCVCLHKYGMTQSQYLILLEDQNNSCKVCEVPQDIDVRMLSVDHDHSCCPIAGSCGRCIRGLLCSRCNRFLGYCFDNIGNIGRMRDYINGK